ncbi:MAG: hypothetical protein ACE5IZ_10025 [Dehalococcoidia bacterium]
MSKRQFYWEWLGRTFIRPLLYIDLLVGILAIVGGAVVFVWPQVAGTVTFLLWAVPAAVFGAFVLVGFLLAPYYMQKKIEQERDGLQAQLDSAPEGLQIATGSWGRVSAGESLSGKAFVWSIQITLTNLSTEIPAGISHIWLEVKREDKPWPLMLVSEWQRAIFKGLPLSQWEYGENIYLLPRQSISGSLDFLDFAAWAEKADVTLVICEGKGYAHRRHLGTL